MLIQDKGRFPYSPNSENFGLEIKRHGPVQFGQTGIFGTSFEGGPL